MHNLNLQVPDTLYAEIAQAVAVRGLSAESVVIGRLDAEFSDDPPASFWTPELLASLNAAAEADRCGGIRLVR